MRRASVERVRTSFSMASRMEIKNGVFNNGTNINAPGLARTHPSEEPSTFERWSSPMAALCMNGN